MYTNASMITETVEGYPVKNILWKPNENIFTGQVKCPILGKPELRDGYITVTWRSNGSLTPKFGGSNRKDLYLNLEMNK